MIGTLRTAALAGALLLGMSAMTAANAEYLGYGNGDPGNWDFATEQSGGPCGKGTARTIDPATGQPSAARSTTPKAPARSSGPVRRTTARHAGCRTSSDRYAEKWAA